MTDNKPTKNYNKECINVSVSRTTHDEVQKHLSEKEFVASIGRFFDKAALEKLAREKEIIEKPKNKKQ